MSIGLQSIPLFYGFHLIFCMDPFLLKVDTKNILDTVEAILSHKNIKELASDLATNAARDFMTEFRSLNNNKQMQRKKRKQPVGQVQKFSDPAEELADKVVQELPVGPDEEIFVETDQSPPREIRIITKELKPNETPFEQPLRPNRLPIRHKRRPIRPNGPDYKLDKSMNIPSGASYMVNSAPNMSNEPLRVLESPSSVIREEPPSNSGPNQEQMIPVYDRYGNPV